MSQHVMIVEDDVILREELAHFLRGYGYTVEEANNSLAVNEQLLSGPVDVLILDVNLPGNSGFDIAEHLRHHRPAIGIIMLTARTTLQDRLKGYESGADIYLPKPAAPEELLAAIQSLCRRMQIQQTDQRWRLDSQRRLLYTLERAEPVALTATESILLQALRQAPNQTMESDALCVLIGQRDNTEPLSKRALENLISRLRKKIGDVLQDKNEPVLRAVWGMGYQLTLPMVVVATGKN